MAKKKLRKFAEVKTFSNVFEFPEKMAGKWNDYFKNKNPFILELGCGKGDYTLALARLFPKKNLIGVDRKADRIWRGAKTALEEKITNATFLRIYIEKITDYFSNGEVDEIWITFPDPFPKRRSVKKRLTSPSFLNMYRQILKPDGLIHLKTDDLRFFQYTIQVLKSEKYKIRKQITDIYSSEVDELLQIKTTYEKRHMEEGRKIHYLCFSF
ncbi:MAG: tRNA (guanosine(46)-N7)-methyltransferase TrmB [Nanoarchaeota archaeon]|nr:tRNA (guanosine(46)-N7)-methyltransferase TrmB [Nanoarchaeota archaeon]